jgi:hypothetical protein
MKADKKPQTDFLTSQIDYNQEKLNADLMEMKEEIKTWNQIEKLRPFEKRQSAIRQR